MSVLALRSAFAIGLPKLSPRLADPDIAVVEFNPDTLPADRYLAVAQLSLTIREHPGLPPNHLLVEASLEALARLAKNEIVLAIYPASEDLRGDEPVFPCSHPAPPPDAGGERETSSGFTLPRWYGWDGYGLNAAKLGWHVGRYSARVPADATHARIEQALREWARYVAISFEERAESGLYRSLDFGFFSGDHGDNTPFDGPGKYLAHTYYPVPNTPEPLAGDVHFDGDESWDSGPGPDVYTVALHEIGHALGLLHSDNPHAVMYPYYRKSSTLLDPDDIAALQSLYLARADAPCVLTLDTTAVSVAAASATLKTTLRTLPACAWSFEPAPSWIKWSGAPAGTGSTAISLALEPNQLPVPRSAVLRVATAGTVTTLTVTQAPARVSPVSVAY